MPFAVERRRVAGLRQQLRDCDLPLHQPIGLAVDRNAVGAVADRMAPDHQRRTRWRARQLDIEIGEARAFAGERIETRGRRAPRDPAAVSAELAIAEIVGEQEHGVGLAFPVGCARQGEREQGNTQSLHGRSPVRWPDIIALTIDVGERRDQRQSEHRVGQSKEPTKRRSNAPIPL